MDRVFKTLLKALIEAQFDKKAPLTTAQFYSIVDAKRFQDYVEGLVKLFVEMKAFPAWRLIKYNVNLEMCHESNEPITANIEIERDTWKFKLSLLTHPQAFYRQLER